MAILKRLWPYLLAVIVVFITVTAVYWYHTWQPWAAIHSGSASGHESEGFYAYWSGFGSVFPWELGIISGVLGLVYQHGRKANCHAHGCWRIGSYPAGDYRVCKKHHYEVHGTHPTIEHLKAHVEEVRNGRLGSDQGVDSSSGVSECAAVIVNVGGVPGHDQPADAAGDPEGPGSEGGSVHGGGPA
jgi:hypothetical protein